MLVHLSLIKLSHSCDIWAVDLDCKQTVNYLFERRNKMKKLVVGGIVSILLLTMGVATFASTFSSPAEGYAHLTGISVEEARLEKGDKTFGQMAEEKGVLDEFRTNMIELKKERLAELVEKGTITQEKADELLAQMTEACTLEPGSRKGLMKELGLRFGEGKGNGSGNGMGRKFRQNRH